MPRGYDSIDVCGFYSEDGTIINIPAERYVYDDKEKELGHYEYIICKYSSVDYTLIAKMDIPDIHPYLWDDIKKWIDENNI